MKVVVAPVSTKIFVLYSLTMVVKKSKEALDGFRILFPEATPSYDDPGVRNLDRPKPHVLIHCIDCMVEARIVQVVDLPLVVNRLDE